MTDYKIVSLAALLERLAENRPKRVVFTNGCFDLLHLGHLVSLESARSLGDLLIVGLNSDSSVRRIKGDGRPIVPEHERARMLAGLECVDYVVIFDEDTPERLLKAIRPDIACKGGKEPPGVEASVGKFFVTETLPEYSTTERLRKIKAT